MKESEVQQRLVKQLRRHHWFVTVFATGHRVKQQMQDWPDVHAIRWGHAQYLEIKSATGEPTTGQWEWRNRFMKHSGPYLRHIFVYPWTELDDILHWGAQYRPHGMEYPPK